MSWFKWRRPTPPSTASLSPPPVEEDEPAPPKMSLLEKIATWRAHYAAEKRAMATAAEIERAREAERARRQEAIEDEFARSIARRGYVWPGESADDDGPASTEPARLPNSFGGWWLRW